MPKYELMYILSSAVTDNDVPTIAAEVDKFITDNGGSLLSQEMMGKKKLAYPIKKTRNGFYVLESFNLDGRKLQDLDNKLRSLEHIIRYMTVNVEDQELRAAKDRKVQEKMRASRKPVKVAVPEEFKLSETELDAKLEQALESEDLVK
ncbi:MAG: 30S ribosomal protein S6 [Candidatus Doudnabacteria bacterium RIFCSPLOWO2_02_FULL_42_9]|uniref:Small ribosomal subunit protein bS6 n=1 Tax=Candidatus Doudnabacteria bacterium RIFCSPHIGHO2_01_FULL_41_86 TaxID=1817821 RepID=A0A1F5N9W7_9BACT|nr:MAG: 30S ribosomal protein S6 [Candidatus Doudnabacteria bacterium RIFCSPHIGHO2_01_FULL_41_86]OGE74716.1 MAG: 30S ribosomal protein S6 [Candidatus Doudnabacteria bacterium RIFCSPHIGHO2_01_43_10]OGE85496.1 MAG: 30S ribosomal protein S6 [Candidatus Doudnabacteria bacterium RIFCSPHIGHO2_12_FULL_42_22]OGE87034.1 MAG: 30S ribosomal protein S6 [Candidatus Doudnabacteria bacterium RIFCSPHIGHO2_02_FULL_42_25]OGE92633.1 MAG: 30S ribosomal protein S6 [Candidatus Doudnabacteria bacterium RIFCSPLOWO2_01